MKMISPALSDRCSYYNSAKVDRMKRARGHMVDVCEERETENSSSEYVMNERKHTERRSTYAGHKFGSRTFIRYTNKHQ